MYAGIGITGHNNNNNKDSIPLRKYWIPRDPYTIQECSSINLEKSLKRANINIMFDSQASLNALSSFTCESKTVKDCTYTLKFLARTTVSI